MFLQRISFDKSVLEGSLIFHYAGKKNISGFLIFLD